MQVRHYSLLDSTNDEARRLLALGELAPGSTTLIVADTQTAGRGTRGRSWCSPTGGLYMTVVHRAPDAHCLAGTGQGEKIENYWLNRLHSPASVALTLAAGIASQHVLNDVIELSTGQRPLRLKPINDVMIPVPRAASGNSEWGGELLKLAGILVETQLLPTGQLSAVMTGIGVNLSHAPAGLPAQAPQSDTTSLTERPYAAACLGQWMPEEEIPPTLVLAEQLASRVSLWYEGIN